MGNPWDIYMGIPWEIHSMGHIHMYIYIYNGYRFHDMEI